MKIELKEIEVNKLKPDKNQPRKNFDEQKLKEMSETFKTQGTIHPIEIDENNIIITGELRYRACKLAGLKTIPCKILKNLTPEQKLERQLVENFNRQDLRLVDSIDAVKRLLRTLQPSKFANKTKEEAIGELAKMLGISRVWLSQNLKLDREAPEELKKAIKEEKISVSQATEIMKLPDKEDREEITKEILEEKEIPEYRKIREKVETIKAKKELDKKSEEIKKTEQYEIKVKKTEEAFNSLKSEIDDTTRRMQKTLVIVSGVRRIKKFYFFKAREKERFFKFLDGTIVQFEIYLKKLKDLRDNIEIEMVRE